MTDDLACWVALHSVPGLGPMAFRRLLNRFGTVRRVLDDGNDEALSEVLRLQPSVCEGILKARARLEWAERLVESLREKGVRVYRCTDPDYPVSLKDLTDAPPLLYVFGDLRPEDRRSVAMVGTTRPSRRGRDIARGIAMRLVRQGITVVSGFAQGIDDASHLSALAEGGRTILCLPFGIRRFRTRSDWPSVREMSGRAVILSEQPPETEWETQAALNRNRVIAALSRAIVIAETSPKGGTMNTFEHAVGLGRPIFCVKYREPPDSARGNAIAIGRGARPIERLGEVSEIVATVDAPTKVE